MTGECPDGLITETPEGLIIRLHLQPRASRTGICGIQGDELKVRVTSPPVDNEANDLCVSYFAKALKLPKSAVSIVSGHRSRHKKILISGIAGNDARQILQLIDKNRI